MVYLPSNKAARAILSELNMCVYIYTKMKKLNFLTKTGWNARTCKSCFWMNIIYFLWSICKKKRLQISWNCAGKRPNFLKKFSKVEMFKTKNNTIIVIWFLYIWCAELRWSEVGIILFNLYNLSHRTLPHSIIYALV